MEENLLETTERLIAAGDSSNDGQIGKNYDKDDKYHKKASETKESEKDQFESKQGIQSCGLLYPELMKDAE